MAFKFFNYDDTRLKGWNLIMDEIMDNNASLKHKLEITKAKKPMP